MKKHHLLLLLTPLLFARLPAAGAEPAAPLSAAVLDFQTSGEKLAGKGAVAATLLNARLSAAPSLLLVERQELEKLLGEQELGLSGTVDPATAAKVGSLTGAKVLVTGRLFEAGEKLFLVAKIMSTETSRVYGETVTFNDLATLDKAVTELAPKIVAVVDRHEDALVAKVETPAAQIERLKKLIEGKKLPSISVSISEQHINHRVADPAAETELRLALQQLGFEVIDTKEITKQADVLLTGEAFSELGARRGNLLSCNARLEVKMVQREPVQRVVVDRQRDVAVDVAENSAGKQALENAARKILDRVVLKLVAQ